ncbi:hypothetical protein P5W98_00730 [Paraburkholderia sp. A1BS-2L]|uniref:hypothetical protein n=1 Tax=Paraburkholderia sp. A1BS-2L TaxID=3028373 RepID=UPI003DA7AB7B
MSPNNRPCSAVFSLRQLLEKGDGQLSSVLSRLDDLACELTDTESFEYRSALPRDVADLQARAGAAFKSRGITDNVQPSEIPAQTIAAHVYGVGRTANLLHAFRWTKKRAISEHLVIIKSSLESSVLLPALVLTRAILEQIGAYALFYRDVSRLSPVDGSPNTGGDWVLDVQFVLFRRGMGTRIDWEDYSANGLKGKRRRGYEVKDGHFDQEARDLLNGIDLVDRSVRGIRNAYEFLSEFGHPNYPSYQLGVVSKEITHHRHGFRMLHKVYTNDSASLITVEELRFLLRDLLELLVASLEHFLDVDGRLKLTEEVIDRKTRAWVKKTLREHPTVFRNADACPCLSGKIVSGCCGRTITNRR